MDSQTKKTNSVVLLLACASLLSTACMPTDFRQVETADSVKTDLPDEPAPGPQPQPSPQPSPPPAVFKSDSFTQDEAANKVDILVIVDNSYSMEVEQKKMGDRFPSFVSALGDLDYQISMTTTDIDSKDEKLNLGGRVVEWTGTKAKALTPKTPNASAVFKNTIKRSETIGCVKRGDCPSGNEQPLKAAILSMEKRNKENASIFRDNVDLAVVVLSDEDEMSDGPSEATKPKDVIDAFKAQFGETKRLRTFGIVIRSGDETCRKEQLAQTEGGKGAYYATHVEHLATLTGGSTNSICDADYSKSLSDISKSVRKLVGTFELTETPVSGTLKVTLTPKPTQAYSYHLEGKNLIFDTPPPAGTKIEVSYEPHR